MAKQKQRIKGLKLRGSVYWWRGKVGGKRVWRSTHCRDWDAAQRRALDMQRELRDQHFGWRTDCPTWDAWLKTYATTHTPRKSPTTRRRDTSILAHATPFFTGRRLDTIRQSDCLKYLQQRRTSLSTNPRKKTQTPLTEATIQRERRLIQAVFEAAVASGHLDRNPWRGVESVPDVARHRVLLPDAEAKLRACLGPRYNRWLTFMLETGLRLEEGRDLDLMHHIRDGCVHVVGKGSKARRVPLTTLAQQTLQAQQEADGQLWVANPNRYREVLTRASERAGTGHLSPHDIRHTFGHRWLVRGGDIYTLSRILGHSSVTTTERHYAYLLAEDIAAKMRAVMEGGAATSVPPPG